MHEIPRETPLPVRGGDVLACGFGMTVAAWLTAYVSRMPLVNAPGQVTVIAMLGMVFVGGIFAARYSPRGLWAAVMAGAVSGLVDLLILGSLLTDAAKGNPTAPSMAALAAGSIACNAVVAGLGGLIGMMAPSARRGQVRWTAVFAVVLVVATLPLITAGGLVTAFKAGLAVPDWPQSYGYNMFLFPLSQMQANPGQDGHETSGKFYEHAHRLMGSLVGFTALTLAIYLTMVEKRRWVKGLVWGIGVCVAIQAVVGGLRVTEKSLALAIAHGIFAQVVFAGMAVLAAVSSRSFVALPRKKSPGASTDHLIAGVLVGMLVLQLMLGALLRHQNRMVLMHVSVAAVAALLVLTAGFRAWGMYGALLPLKRTGIAIMLLGLMQLTLGVFALVFRPGPDMPPTVEGAFLTTAHQANGALLLATAAVLWVWNLRLLQENNSPE